MGVGVGQVLIILLIVLVLFGAGKLPQVMADLGKGLRAFREGTRGDFDARKSENVLNSEKVDDVNK